MSLILRSFVVDWTLCISIIEWNCKNKDKFIGSNLHVKVAKIEIQYKKMCQLI